jgi:hypothetical protein
MKKESFFGIVVILIVVSIVFGILYQINENYFSDIYIVTSMIIFAGILSGFLLNEHFNPALTYIFVIGEALIGIGFIAMFLILQDFQNQVSNTIIAGSEGIAIILIIILFFAILVGGAIFLGIFIVLLLLGGLFGIKIRGFFFKNSNV